MSRIFFCVFLSCLWSLNSFGAQPPKCDDKTYLVRAHHRGAYVRADGVSVSATNVSAYCKERSPLYDKWNPRFLSKPPAAWPSGEKLKDWTDEQRERVLDVLEQLPSTLTSQQTKAILRFETSKAAASNPGAMAVGYMVLYDAAFSSKQNLTRIIAHEFSHELYQSLPSSLRDDYQKATGWKTTMEGRRIFIARRKSGYVEEDGENSAEEDFANNLEYYITDPAKLKSVTPSAFQWFHRYYGSSMDLKKKGNR